MIRYLKQLWCAQQGHPYPTISVPIVGPRPEDGETDRVFCRNCGADRTEFTPADGSGAT